MQIKTLQTNTYPIPDGYIQGSLTSEFENAVRLGAAVITVPGPNAQYGVMAGRSRLVATMNGQFYPGPLYMMGAKPVVPPMKAPEVADGAPSVPYKPVNLKLPATTIAGGAESNFQDPK